MNPLPAHLLAFAGAALGTPWLAWHEAMIQSKGTPLDTHLLNWARQSGITNPEKVHVLATNVIPLPTPMFLRRVLDKRGFPWIHFAGLSLLRNGIYRAETSRNDGDIPKHELIHTRQYQQAGSIFEFLHRYLHQCLTESYYNCEMECEERNDSYS